MLEQVGRSTDPGKQQLGSQAGHERAISATNIQYTGGDKRTNRFADGAATGPQRIGELGLRWQALTGDQVTRGDEVPHLLDGRLGQRRCHVQNHLRISESVTRHLMFDALLYPTMTLLLGQRDGEPYRGGRHDDQLAATWRAAPACPMIAQRRQFRLLRVALAVIRLGPVLILSPSSWP